MQGLRQRFPPSHLPPPEGGVRRTWPPSEPLNPAAPLRDPGVEFGRPTSKRPDFNACVCALASHSSGCVCSNDGLWSGFPLPRRRGEMKESPSVSAENLVLLSVFLFFTFFFPASLFFSVSSLLLDNSALINIDNRNT